MEGLIAHVPDRILGPLHRALANSGLTLDQIDAIELVGGSTRVHASVNASKMLPLDICWIGVVVLPGQGCHAGSAILFRYRKE